MSSKKNNPSSPDQDNFLKTLPLLSELGESSGPIASSSTSKTPAEQLKMSALAKSAKAAAIKRGRGRGNKRGSQSTRESAMATMLARKNKGKDNIRPMDVEQPDDQPLEIEEQDVPQDDLSNEDSDQESDNEESVEESDNDTGEIINPTNTAIINPLADTYDPEDLTDQELIVNNNEAPVIGENNDPIETNKYLIGLHSGLISITVKSIGQIVKQFIKSNLLIHVVHKEDLTIYIPRRKLSSYISALEYDPANPYWAKVKSIHPLWTYSTLTRMGTPLFTAMFFFACSDPKGIKVRVYDHGKDDICVERAVTPLCYLPNHERTSLSKAAMLNVYVYLIIRGGNLNNESHRIGSGIPKFMSDQLGMKTSIKDQADLVCSFPIIKVGNEWIQYVKITDAAKEILQRIGLGVAGYRLFQPFAFLDKRERFTFKWATDELIRMGLRKLKNGKNEIFSYDPNNKDDRSDIELFVPSELPIDQEESEAAYLKLSNSYDFAHKVATSPATWRFHPATRDPVLIEKFGSFNEGLNNLMLWMFKDVDLEKLSNRDIKILFKMPKFDPKSMKFKNWNIKDLGSMDDVILPGASVAT